MNNRRALVFASVALLTGCERQQPSNQVENEPTPASVAFSIYSFFFTNPLIRLISALKIVGDIAKLAESATRDSSSGLVSFPTNNPGVYGSIQSNYVDNNLYFRLPTAQKINFDPNYFVKESGVDANNDFSISEVDQKIISDMSECTMSAFNSGKVDFISVLDYRLECMRQKGYSDNSVSYALIKHQKYNDV